MVDNSLPVRSRVAPRAALMVGCLLFIPVTVVLALWLPASAGTQPETVPLSTPAARIYLPAVSGGNAAPSGRSSRVYLPALFNRASLAYQCPTASDVQWYSVETTQRFISGAATSPDLNMYVRGWRAVDEHLGFVPYDYPPDQPPDTVHPLHLSTITGAGAAGFRSTYQVNDWDWLGCNCAVPRPRSPYTVTMLGLRTTPGQPLHIPSRDASLNARGFKATVMYADAGQLAVKYTAEDRVDTGYLVHLINLCVDPKLLALYRQLDSQGRRALPGVYNESIVGTASGDEVRVIVRDTGAFLDPRSWQDWWQDQPKPAGW